MGSSLDNKPDVEEIFVLPEGIDKVSSVNDTKLVNAVNYTIEKEGHTVGNLLRMQLLRDPDVIFGGYKVPHPLEYHSVVKVQTSENSTPLDAMTTSIQALRQELKGISDTFESQMNVEADPHRQCQ